MLFAPLSLLRTVLDHPFNRRRRVAAVTRFVRWQVSSRLALGPVLVDFVETMKLCVSPGMTGATGNVYAGLHEFDDMAFVLHVLRSGDLLLDIGANVGSYTLLGAAAAARVIAFEPVPATFARLSLNVRINDLAGAVDPRQQAVGRAPGTLSFTAGHDTVNHVAAGGEAGELQVPVTTVDNVMAAESGDGALLIKIDVEGFETEALAGAAATLASPRLLAVIMELNGSGARYGFDDAALHAAMLGHGFLPYAYDGFTRQLATLEGRNANGGNTLYIRDIDAVRARVQDARAFNVQGRQI